MCFAAIHWAKIKKIVYGARIEDSRKFGFSEMSLSNSLLKKLGEAKIDIEGDVLREEVIKLFVYWSKKNGNKTY
jgi:tRNA(Arg) A34 adenosine deaminase TadA